MTKQELLDGIKSLTDKAESANKQYNRAKADCLATCMIRTIKGERMEPGSALWEFVGDAEQTAKRKLADDVLALMPEADGLMVEANLQNLEEDYRKALADFLELSTVISESGILA